MKREELAVYGKDKEQWKLCCQFNESWILHNHLVVEVLSTRGGIPPHEYLIYLTELIGLDKN